MLFKWDSDSNNCNDLNEVHIREYIAFVNIAFPLNCERHIVIGNWMEAKDCEIGLEDWHYINPNKCVNKDISSGLAMLKVQQFQFSCLREYSKYATFDIIHLPDALFDYSITVDDVDPDPINEDLWFRYSVSGNGGPVTPASERIIW